MKQLLPVALAGAAAVGVWRWYTQEDVRELPATVHLQSEHEHFHLHVDLPPGEEIQPGDTVIICSLPDIPQQTEGEISYDSAVRLHKASWLRRVLVKNSSLVEVNELIDHP